jgi:hypothetical protein
MGTNVNPASFSHEDATAIDANSYTRLADNPLSSVTQYVRQQVIGAGDYLELTMADTAATCIVGVSGIVAYHSAGTPVNDGKASIFDGATERVIVSGDLSLVPLQYASAIVAPAAGTWTTGAVNGLQARVGYSADVTQPVLGSVLLEVATGTECRASSRSYRRRAARQSRRRTATSGPRRPRPELVDDPRSPYQYARLAGACVRTHRSNST